MIPNKPTMNIEIAGFRQESTSDGPGVRGVLFLQGCSRKCAGCHNTSTHKKGLGKTMTIDELIVMLEERFMFRRKKNNHLWWWASWPAWGIGRTCLQIVRFELWYLLIYKLPIRRCLFNHTRKTEQYKDRTIHPEQEESRNNILWILKSNVFPKH